MNLRTQLDNIDMQEKRRNDRKSGGAMEAKRNIRKKFLPERRAATQEEIQEKSRMIYEKITALPEGLWMRTALRIWTLKRSHDTGSDREGPANGKDGPVPRVEGDDMVYYEIKDFSTLKSGYFGIMEPDGGKVCTRKRAFCWYRCGL